jgi:pyruvate kinase
MASSRSQIIATIGPASGTVEILREMVRHHMDVMRLNLSWGTHDEHASYIDALRTVEAEAGTHIPVILDLSGPRTQTAAGHQFDAEHYRPGKGLLTEKDIEDLRFGLAKGVGYVAVSYVGGKADVEEARVAIAAEGGSARVIAKIERREAVDNADEIILAADAVMVARGDLGLEVPIEQIPFIEKDLIEKCNRAGKPVITATQMLLSMVASREPTRAEVTDVAYAIGIGSDAVMLSEETARGAYPVEVIIAMEKIVFEAELHAPERTVHLL